ncbi:MAG: MBL fold metallo-hydrolase, partial [Chitinophagia bacterium]|nr:MBL fold metallo-hydrolase [Chitinophagia bacterium]
MKITFHGAARTVTGSKHLLQLADGRQLLLDCGMFQGMGKDTIRLNREWGFDPAAIDVVIISHAHIDHVGLLPRLVRDGFRGQVFATPQTIELARLLLLDSAHIQEADVLHLNKIRIHKGQAPAEPLYTEDDVLNAMPLFVPMAYDNTFEVMKGVQCTFTDAGHILGSAAVNLLVTDKGTTRRITFSGDVGRYRDLILRSPSPFPQADYLILESTYGNRLHDLVVHSQGDLLHHITETCLKRHGKLIIPSFSVGRTQELLYLLNRLSLEHRLPLVDYFVDSPLSTEATRVMKEHPECFNRDVQHLLKQDDDVFSFPGLHFTQTVDES